jgi:hypothetical protein
MKPTRKHCNPKSKQEYDLMTDTDLQGLHGIHRPSLRWAAELGTLGRSIYDAATGDRSIEVIDLGSPAATLAMDYGCRERGYGRIRTGDYSMILTPAGSPLPPWPGDDEYKAAVGVFLWNPSLGEVRLEANGAILVRAVSGLWDQCRGYKEAAEGLQPVVCFAGRREHLVKSIGKMFWAPVIEIKGWLPRNKIPSFAAREPTVRPPIPLDSQVRHTLLADLNRDKPTRARGKAKSPAVPKRGSLQELIDDEIPEL